MLSNLRATLDYLVWQLVLAAGKTPTDEHAFPCVKDARNWGSARGRRLVDVDPIWIDQIEKLQPYHRANQSERDFLAVLDYINNVNKHRTLPPVIVTAEEFEFTFGHQDLGRREFRPDSFLDRPIEDGVEFFSASFDPPLSELQYGDPPLRISFRDGMDRSDGWGYTNADLIDRVESVIAIFKPAFPG